MSYPERVSGEYITGQQSTFAFRRSRYTRTKNQLSTKKIIQSKVTELESGGKLPQTSIGGGGLGSLSQ